MRKICTQPESEAVMKKFESVLDDFLYKARNVADAAGKKTGEAVNISKLKYQIKQTQWDIEKAYAKLGAFVYESRKSDEDFSDLINLSTGEIDLLCEKLDNLEQQVLNCKKVVKCSSCGKENDLPNAYCARCGSSLADDKKAAAQVEEDEVTTTAAEVAEAMDEVRKAAEDHVEGEFHEHNQD